MTLPLAPGACGQPPMRPGRHRSGSRRSQAPPAHWPGPGRACRGSVRSGSDPRRWPPRVRTARAPCADRRSHGIRQADAVGAGIEQRLHQPQHLAGIDPALQRAAKRGRPRPLRSAFWSRLRRVLPECERLPPRRRRVSCAGWQGCGRDWRKAAPASGPHRCRWRSPRHAGWGRERIRTSPAASVRKPPVRQCRQVAEAAWPERMSLLRFHAGRRHEQRESTPFSVRSERPSEYFAIHRAGRLRGSPRVSAMAPCWRRMLASCLIP